MAETGESKKSWRERHKVDWGDRMKEKHEALKTKEVGEPKPKTVAKIQRVFLIVGITITVLGVLGLLLTRLLG